VAKLNIEVDLVNNEIVLIPQDNEANAVLSGFIRNHDFGPHIDCGRGLICRTCNKTIPNGDLNDYEHNNCM